LGGANETLRFTATLSQTPSAQFGLGSYAVNNMDAGGRLLRKIRLQEMTPRCGDIVAFESLYSLQRTLPQRAGTARIVFSAVAHGRFAA